MKNLIFASAMLGLACCGGCRWFQDCGCEPQPTFAGPAPPYYPPPGGAAAPGAPSPVYVQPGEPVDSYTPPPTQAP
jgi:hypothetical protein